MLLKEYPYITFLSFAKSGARLSSCLEGQEHDLLEQLAEVKRAVGAHPIDALLVSIGGNDVGFATTLENLTKHGGLLSGEPLESRKARILERIARLDTTSYPKVNRTIANLQLNVGAIVINEYPGSLFNNSRDSARSGCGVFKVAEGFAGWLSVTMEEARMIDEMGDSLNATVARAARREGWRLVDGIDEAFAGHGYCSNQSWFVSAENSCLTQGDFEGTMHPNAEATGVIAHAIARELRRVLPKPGAGQPTAPRP
jgi:lysophospholipase L1-like esterase